MDSQATSDLEPGSHNLEFLFHPQSIAIAGIPTDSSDPRQARFLKPLIDFGFPGRIYLVNPKGGEIRGFKVYSTIEEIPDSVDYVIVAAPARSAPQLLQDCIGKGAETIQFFTAGFSETGNEEGMLIETEIAQLARKGAVRIIGPNCLGIYCPKTRLSYRSEFPRESGPVGFLCQSGGNSIHMVHLGASRGVRFSKIVSYGNACDLNESDFLEYFTWDPETKVIGIYVEGVKEGLRFAKALAEAAKEKPVILLKGGQGEAGTRAVAGHTGALSGSNTTWDALCRQLGIVRVSNLEELADMMVTFLFMPPPRGRNVAIVGIGGGASVLATDSCESHNLVVPPLTEELREHLKRFTPDAGNIIRNPIDSQWFLWAPKEFINTIRIVSQWEKIDFLLIHLMPGDLNPYWQVPPFDGQNMYGMMVETILNSTRACSKPVAIVAQSSIWPQTYMENFHILQKLISAGLPIYSTFDGAANAVDKLIVYHEHRARSTPGRSEKL